MSYETKTITEYSIVCDVCERRLEDDYRESWWRDSDDADFAAEDMGWHRYDQPDGDAKHICLKCLEKSYDSTH